MSDPTQEAVDRFYWSQAKPCCAGCDWWARLNALVGECRQSAPVSSKDRWAMIGITGSSLQTGGGHIATLRDHSCGQFRDSFDWASLPPWYQRKVGVRTGVSTTPRHDNPTAPEYPSCSAS